MFPDDVNGMLVAQNIMRGCKRRTTKVTIKRLIRVNALDVITKGSPILERRTTVTNVVLGVSMSLHVALEVVGRLANVPTPFNAARKLWGSVTALCPLVTLQSYLLRELHVTFATFVDGGSILDVSVQPLSLCVTLRASHCTTCTPTKERRRHGFGK